MGVLCREKFARPLNVMLSACAPHVKLTVCEPPAQGGEYGDTGAQEAVTTPGTRGQAVAIPEVQVIPNNAMHPTLCHHDHKGEKTSGSLY